MNLRCGALRLRHGVYQSVILLRGILVPRVKYSGAADKIGCESERVLTPTRMIVIYGIVI